MEMTSKRPVTRRRTVVDVKTVVRSFHFVEVLEN